MMNAEGGGMHRIGSRERQGDHVQPIWRTSWAEQLVDTCVMTGGEEGPARVDEGGRAIDTAKAVFLDVPSTRSCSNYGHRHLPCNATRRRRWDWVEDRGGGKRSDEGS